MSWRGRLLRTRSYRADWNIRPRGVHHCDQPGSGQKNDQTPERPSQQIILLAPNGTSGPQRRLCDLRRYLRPNTLGAVFRSIVDCQSIRKTFRIRGQRYLQVKRSAVAIPGESAIGRERCSTGGPRPGTLTMGPPPVVILGGRKDRLIAFPKSGSKERKAM